MDEVDEKNCELLENCSFYWSYRNHPWVLKMNLLSEFCYSCEGKTYSCSRVRYFMEFGEIAPPSLTPSGEIIGGVKDSETGFLPTRRPAQR
ncbi:MAG: hypothetical protein RQ801_10295 [Spirochaetaceae bacterium]|nr:hypothetical protein [Spirochaetaceae bacterium]